MALVPLVAVFVCRLSAEIKSFYMRDNDDKTVAALTCSRRASASWSTVSAKKVMRSSSRK